MNIIPYAQALSPRLALRSYTQKLSSLIRGQVSVCGHTSPKSIVKEAKIGIRGSPRKIPRPAFAGGTLKSQILESSRGKKAQQAGKRGLAPAPSSHPKAHFPRTGSILHQAASCL